MRIFYLISPILVASIITLSACKEQPEPPKAQESVMQALITENLKSFALTQDDLTVIRALSEYDARFSEMSDASEDELIAMREAGTLSEDFALLRKRDTIQSALIMLKNLQLKTEQGRYIQSLMYRYWEQQNQLYSQKIAATTPLTQQQIPMQGIGDFLHAHEQLEHWQAQYQAQS